MRAEGTDVSHGVRTGLQYDDRVGTGLSDREVALNHGHARLRQNDLDAPLRPRLLVALDPPMP